MPIAGELGGDVDVDHPLQPVVAVHVPQQRVEAEAAVRVVRVADDLVEDLVEEVGLGGFAGEADGGLHRALGGLFRLLRRDDERHADHQEQDQQAEDDQQEDAAAGAAGGVQLRAAGEEPGAAGRAGAAGASDAGAAGACDDGDVLLDATRGAAKHDVYPVILVCPKYASVALRYELQLVGCCSTRCLLLVLALAISATSIAASRYLLCSSPSAASAWRR